MALTAKFPAIRFLTLVLTAATGAAGLIYEVTWHRYLANFIGSEARAAAIILSVFLSGLCAGYYLFGSFSRGRNRASLLLTCGAAELGIGGWALIFPDLYRIFWQHTGILEYGGTFALLEDVMICALMIFIPTTLMGGTLPLLTQALSKDRRDSSSFHALVYAVNTGGAFVGCLLAGFYLLPILGPARTMQVAAVINIAAGALIVLFAIPLRKAEPLSQVEDVTPISNAKFMALGRATLVAFLAGFYSLSLQVVFMRLVGLSMGSSEYAFSMVVSVFVLMLAVGSWALAGKAKIPLWANQLFAALGLTLIYLSVPYWSYSSHVVRSLFSMVEPNFYFYHAAMFCVLSVVLSIAVAPMGATLPALFAAVRCDMEKLGSAVGRLYGVNTLGCALGALTGGYLFLYYVDLEQIFILSLGLLFFTVIACANWRMMGFFRSFLAISGFALGMCFIWLAPHWDKMILTIGSFRTRIATGETFEGPAAFYKWLHEDRRLTAYKDDPNTSVSVIERDLSEKPGDIARSIWVNGKSDGTTAGLDLLTMRLSGHLPALFQSSTEKRAAVIGFGTGVTVGALSLYSEFDKIDCIEISPFIQRFAPYFDFANHQVSKNPHVVWHRGDAYRVLGSSPANYSVIMSEPSNPWVTGVERLFTQEFYRIVKQHLAPGGVYAQWFHTYNIRKHSLKLVLKTFTSVFPHVRVFDLDRDLILLGSLDPIGEKQMPLLTERIVRPEVLKEMTELDVTSVDKLLSYEKIVPESFYKDSPLHTLEFPKLAYWAGRDFFFSETFSLGDELKSEGLAEAQAEGGQKTLLELNKSIQ